MPLYELIVITRCGEARNTANFFRQVALSIFAAGGTIRKIIIIHNIKRKCKRIKSIR